MRKAFTVIIDAPDGTRCITEILAATLVCPAIPGWGVTVAEMQGGRRASVLEQWETAATGAHGGAAEARPLLTAARLILAGDALYSWITEET